MKIILLMFFAKSVNAADFFIRPQAGVSLSTIKVESSNPGIAVNTTRVDKMAGIVLGLRGDHLSVYSDIQYELVDQDRSSHTGSGANVSIGAAMMLGFLRVSGSVIGYSYLRDGTHVYKGRGAKIGAGIYGDVFSANLELSYREFDLTYNGTPVNNKASSASLHAYIGAYLF